MGCSSRDTVLRSVTVGDLAEELGGEVLCAEDHLDELVETFALGAMSGESAFRFFQRKPNKAVITGGDRSDVIMAALRTSTKALILTGNLRPAVLVLSAAADQGVPMIHGSRGHPFHHRTGRAGHRPCAVVQPQANSQAQGDHARVREHGAGHS